MITIKIKITKAKYSDLLEVLSTQPHHIVNQFLIKGYGVFCFDQLQYVPQAFLPFIIPYSPMDSMNKAKLNDTIKKIIQ